MTLVGWGGDYRHLRLLTPAECTKALTGSGTAERNQSTDVVVVPWRSTYLLPELSALALPRNEHIAQLSAVRPAAAPGASGSTACR